MGGYVCTCTHTDGITTIPIVALLDKWLQFNQIYSELDTLKLMYLTFILINFSGFKIYIALITNKKKVFLLKRRGSMSVLVRNNFLLVYRKAL